MSDTPKRDTTKRGDFIRVSAAPADGTAIGGAIQPMWTVLVVAVFVAQCDENGVPRMDTYSMVLFADTHRQAVEFAGQDIHDALTENGLGPVEIWPAACFLGRQENLLNEYAATFGDEEEGHDAG